ncbi:MAG: hypothetical protein IPI67_23595 [Myxococcales bacterium]|nr:hypothetical protein [Myxococcales bacterium]
MTFKNTKKGGGVYDFTAGDATAACTYVAGSNVYSVLYSSGLGSLNVG